MHPAQRPERQRYATAGIGTYVCSLGAAVGKEW